MPNRPMAPGTWAIALCFLAASLPLHGQVFPMSFSNWTTLSATIVETQYYKPGYCPDSGGSCTYVYTEPYLWFSWHLKGCVQRLSGQSWLPASGSEAGRIGVQSVESWNLSAGGLYRYVFSDQAASSGYSDSWLYEIDADLNTGTVDFITKQRLDLPGESITWVGTGKALLTLDPALSFLFCSSTTPIRFLRPHAGGDLLAGTLLAAEPASGIAADGFSYGVVVVEGYPSVPITLTTSGGMLYPLEQAPSGDEWNGVGSLSFTPVARYINGKTVYAALLRAPEMPPALANGLSTLAVAAASSGQLAPTSLMLSVYAPPLVLVHGIWSDGHTWDSFRDFLTRNKYPAVSIRVADYRPYNARSFKDAMVQKRLSTEVNAALEHAKTKGLIAQRVDVAAHSAGGLATRYFVRNAANRSVNQLLTVGTPHQGSCLARKLFEAVDKLPKAGSALWWLMPLMPPMVVSNLGDLMASVGRDPRQGAVEALVGPCPATLNADDLVASTPGFTYSSIQGSAPDHNSLTDGMNLLLASFSPPDTVFSLLGSGNDAIVPAESQTHGAGYKSSLPGINHLQEPGSGNVASQFLVWLLIPPALRSVNSSVLAPAASSALAPANSSDPWPPDLSGYSRAPDGTASFSPPSGTTLPLLETTTVTVSSAAKRITRVIVWQDLGAMDLTTAPFEFPLNPAEIGAQDVLALVLYSDSTLTPARLQYSAAPDGNVLDLNAPVAQLYFDNVGDQSLIDLVATYPAGKVHVGANATYTTGSGAASVIKIDSTGLATAMGTGADVVSATLGGRTVQMVARVGGCAYSISSTSPIIGPGGGPLSVQVNADPGCQWFAATAAPWLQITSGSSGQGPGIVVLQTQANSGTSSRADNVMVGDRSLSIVQSPAGCSYQVAGAPSSIPSAGGNFTLTVSAADGCWWTAATSADWVSANSAGAVSGNGSVFFTVSPSNSSTARTATVTIASQAISVTQSAVTGPLILDNGIVNSATFKVEALSPGAWFSIFGLNLGSAAQWTSTSTLVLGGAMVTLCGLPAVLSYNSGPLVANGTTLWQINALMPDGVAGQTSCPVMVVVNGQISPTASVMIAAGVMELFGFTSSGGPLPIVTHSDYSLVGPASAGLKPARPGETLVAWGTGDCIAPVVTIGNANAPVSYSGRVAPGLCQLNLLVPSGLAGQNPLRISTSPSSYTLWLTP